MGAGFRNLGSLNFRQGIYVILFESSAVVDDFSEYAADRLCIERSLCVRSKALKEGFFASWIVDGEIFDSLEIADSHDYFGALLEHAQKFVIEAINRVAQFFEFRVVEHWAELTSRIQASREAEDASSSS